MCFDHMGLFLATELPWRWRAKLVSGCIFKYFYNLSHPPSNIRLVLIYCSFFPHVLALGDSLQPSHILITTRLPRRCVKLCLKAVKKKVLFTQWKDVWNWKMNKYRWQNTWYVRSVTFWSISNNISTSDMETLLYVCSMYRKMCPSSWTDSLSL